MYTNGSNAKTVYCKQRLFGLMKINLLCLYIHTCLDVLSGLNC